MTEVVAALIWDGDRFLICQRPAHKARGLLWEFVGGKVEPGETKAEALIRECREELDITVSVGALFMELTHVYPDLTVHLSLFHASIAAGEPKMIEHNDLRWITPAEIPRYEFCPADAEILKRLMGEKKLDAHGYWHAVLAQDPEAMARYLRHDAVIRWHNTNECFTAEEFIRVNCAYPGRWRGEIQRVEQVGNLTVTVVRVYGPQGRPSFHVTSFLTASGGKITALDEYWGDDGPPPEWRSAMGLGRSIQ